MSTRIAINAVSDNELCRIRVRGHCMDTPEAPMRIKDGSELVVRCVPATLAEAVRARGLLVVVHTPTGCYCKHLTAVNVRRKEISLTV